MKGINQNELLNQDMKIHYCDVCTWLALMLDMGYVEKMVFCLKNYSDLLWEYIFLNVSSFRKDFLASSKMNENMSTGGIIVLLLKIFGSFLEVHIH